MQDLRKYTHSQLLEMEGQEIEFRTSLEQQVQVDRTYIYNVASVKISGLRGLSVYVDLFNSEKQNIATISVFTNETLEVYDISGPGFSVCK